LQVAKFAVNVNLSQLVDTALSEELVLNGPSVNPYLIFAQLECQRKNYGAAIEYLNQALSIDGTDKRIWEEIGIHKSKKGHLKFNQKKYKDAKIAYQTVLSSNQFSSDLVSNRLGNFYLLETF
jgi:tetratricopeptide (TPR) repeat protein